MKTAKQPPRDPRVPKTLDQKLRDLQYHSHQVRHLLSSLSHNQDHFKALATELRTLLCYSGKTEGLLWRLLDSLRLDDSVFVHQPPQLNAAHPLAKALAFTVCPLRRTSIWNEANVAKRSFRQLIKNCNAASVGSTQLTHEALIRKIAEQTGSAHEAEKIDPELIVLFGINVDGTSLLLELLCTNAWLAVELSEKALEHARESVGFSRASLSANDGDFGLFVAIAGTIKPTVSHSIMCARSEVSRLEVCAAASPEGFQFVIARPESRLTVITVPWIGAFDGNDTHIFALCYSSKLRKFRWLTPQSAATPADLDLGWLDSSSFQVSVGKDPIDGTLSFRMTGLLCALISEGDLRSMYNDAPSGKFDILESSDEAAARGGFP